MKIPAQLLEDLRRVPGFNEDEFTEAHSTAADTSVRLHPGRVGGGLTLAAPVPWCGNGYYLGERPVFTLDPAYHGGAYYVQEASSMFLEHIWKNAVTDNGALRVLDLCAAPGGKSTHLASLLQGDSLLISNEVIRNRATILEENMVRWGYTNNWVTCNDPRDFSKLTGYFDVIVIDAPCSGSGLFRKDTHALDTWSEENVTLCALRQKRIIDDIWPALKQDGILIYATCSFSTQEDEGLLDWLAATYEVESLAPQVPAEWGITPIYSPEKNMGGYRFFPGKARGEGFFIAAVQKKAEADELKPIKFKPAISKIKDLVLPLLTNSRAFQFIASAADAYNAIAPAHEGDYLLLQKILYFRKAGLPLGAPAHKDWLPAHALALSLDAAADIPAIELNKEQALRFLKREDINIEEMAKGWRVIKFNNLGLGWVKCLGNRTNNYLPKHWRIRMELPDNDAG
ncbi:MAG: hypothetical protein H7257_11725 [Taibaiella sp.]|nr:hypothetical protein [Taibaiella sp.]